MTKEKIIRFIYLLIEENRIALNAEEEKTYDYGDFHSYFAEGYSQARIHCLAGEQYDLYAIIRRLEELE